jgi:hypothetical protein
MEPESSLQCSLVFVTGLHPEPDKSSQYPPIPFIQTTILTLSCHLRLRFPSGIFPQV